MLSHTLPVWLQKIHSLASQRHRLKRQAQAYCEMLVKEHALAPLEYVLVVRNNFNAR